MTVEELKQVFLSMDPSDSWDIQLLQIKSGETDVAVYAARDIVLEPEGSLGNLVREIQKRYAESERSLLNSFSEVAEYDTSAISTTIYRLDGNNRLIQEQYRNLLNAMGKPEREESLNTFEAKASVIRGTTQTGEEKKPIVLVSMRSPVTTLKHKFYYEAGRYREITDKVLSLRSTVDVVLYNGAAFLLTLEGEKLFQMERAYKNVSAKKVEDIIKENFVTDSEAFRDTASKGFNPRRFVSFNQERFDSLKNEKTRRKMARYFSIPMKGSQFDTSAPENADKLIRLLCNKGMTDPFKNVPVEVSGAKRWV